jgi:hypothetical protein
MPFTGLKIDAGEGPNHMLVVKLTVLTLDPFQLQPYQMNFEAAWEASAVDDYRALAHQLLKIGEDMLRCTDDAHR